MIPVTLFTGFLGAGKTTTLKHCLRVREERGEVGRLAVIINEFASIGLDAMQLPEGQYEVFELNRGSIFCVCLRTDFIALMTRVVEEVRADEIWVEATGVANVEDVLKMLSVPTLQGRVYLRTILTLVDPHTIGKVLATLRAAQQQVTCADALIVNKTDTCDETHLARVEEELRRYNAHAPILRVSHGAIDLDMVPSFDLPRLDSRPFEGHPPQPITSVSVCEDWTLDPERVREWIQTQGETIWRAKGRLKTPAEMQWLEATLHEISFRPWREERALPAATALAFVGPNLERDVVYAALAACRVG